MQLTPNDLLAFLPLGTAIVFAARVVLGIRTIGAFAPALLAVTTMQAGISSTASMLLIAGGTGLAAAALLERFAIPRASRLAILVVAVCASLVATGAIDGDGAAFPLVVVAIIVERTWESARADGPASAAQLYLTTIGIAFGVSAVLSLLAPHITGRHWLPMAAIGIAVNLAVGSYRGLRLSELRRFAALRTQPATS